MAFALRQPFPPMEARSVEEIPIGEDWQYEPKWDGFRCLAFRDGTEIHLQSKAGQPLARYFPDVVTALSQLEAKRFVIDGELVIPVGGALSFDELQLRLHPAASRVRKLAAAHPAMFIAFDLLADEKGKSLVQQPLRIRRKALEKFARANLKAKRAIRLSPATTYLAVAKKWFDKVGGNLDGVIAKQIDAPYASGERTAMVKVKQIRSADCVGGGFRYAASARLIGSLLLGLYGDDGLLHHVGFTSAFKADDRRELTRKFEALKKEPGFTGNAPGGPSRWSTERSGEWEPVNPKVVVEVAYDHFTGGRFRHGTQILRRRPDKSPKQCTMDQVEDREGKSLALLGASARDLACRAGRRAKRPFSANHVGFRRVAKKSTRVACAPRRSTSNAVIATSLAR
jgi:ATP-dependent DNA ligase